MQCSACGATWTLPPNARTNRDTCPFCGASLLTPATSLEEALRKMIALSGENVLRSSSALLSCFADTAPQLQKERLLLRYLVYKDTHLKLLDAVNAPPAQQRLIYSRAVHTLHQEQFIVKEAAELVCAGFLAALGVSLPREASPEKKDPPPAKPAPEKKTPPAASAPAKTAPPAQTAPASGNAGTAIHSRAEYLKALKELAQQNGSKPLNNAQILRFLWTHKLDIRLGITLADAQKDLQTLFPPKPAAAPARKPISTYNDYLDALRALCVSNGSKPLSRSQIQQFLTDNKLSERFGVTVWDVELDLKKIRTPASDPAAEPAVPPVLKYISNYADYLAALRALYAHNGSKPLSRSQIQQFLADNKLNERFGITAWDVEKDLRSIAGETK